MLIAMAGLLAACHESLGIVGDASHDVRIDTSVDPPTDVSDGTSDGWMDPVPPPDAPVDVPPDGPTACPEPMTILADWSLDGSSVDEGRDIATPCVVEVVMDEPEDGYTYVELLCGTGGLMEIHTIELWAEPHVWSGLWEGEEVFLRYRSDHFWWINRWFAIQDAWGGLRLAGVDADWIQPPAREDWYDPIEVRPVNGFCEPYDEPWGCGVVERQGLEVGTWDARAIVFDSTYAYAGFMETVLVQVEQATHYLELWCEDAPGAWYKALFVFYMEG